jgi:ubiquinone/menaquinone biosynthesis C-methylase UbiE
MDHADHVNLLRKGIESPGGVWADLGAGTGAFTLALADLLGPGAEIYAVDRDSTALQTNGRAMRSMFPATGVHYRTADFTRPLDLPLLDGVVMANSLHFQRRQEEVVARVRGYLRASGRLLVVEYNISRGNFAVPGTVFEVAGPRPPRRFRPNGTAGYPPEPFSEGDLLGSELVTAPIRGRRAAPRCHRATSL